MNITAEIKTNNSRVIEYLLSPMQRAGSERLTELYISGLHSKNCNFMNSQVKGNKSEA
jgi:hypothetical protein